MIVERIGDLLAQKDVQIIAHQTNCIGVMGAGIAAQIKKKLLSKDEYEKYTDKCKEYGESLLGKVQLLNASDGRIIANLFGENKPTGKGRDTNYEAIYLCLVKLKNYAVKEHKVVGIPGLLGCGLAGGDWNIVRAMIRSVFSEEDIVVAITYFNPEDYKKYNS